MRFDRRRLDDLRAVSGSQTRPDQVCRLGLRKVNETATGRPLDTVAGAADGDEQPDPHHDGLFLGSPLTMNPEMTAPVVIVPDDVTTMRTYRFVPL